jgi:hypothetical protein
MQLTWTRLTPDIWMSNDRSWLITKNKFTKQFALDDLPADEFAVFRAATLEAVKAEAQRRSTEAYLAILGRDGALDFGEPMEAGMPTHRQTI